MTEHVHPSVTPPGGGGSLPYGDVPLEKGSTFSDFWGKKDPHIYGWQNYQNICSVGEK